MLKKLKRSKKTAQKPQETFGPIRIRDIAKEEAASKREKELAEMKAAEEENTNTESENLTEAEIIETDTEHNREKFRFEPNKKYFTICVYALGLIAVAMLVIECVINIPALAGAVSKFFSIIQPFIVAFFIAFIINPIVRSLSERFFKNVCHIKKSKVRLGLGILTAYVIVLGLIIGFSIYVIPQIASSIEELVRKMPDLYDQIMNFLNTIETRFPDLDLKLVEDKITELMPQLISYGTDFVKNAIPAIFDLSISIAKITINVFLSIAISIYMLFDKRDLSKNSTRVLFSIIPKKRAEGMLEISKECGNIFTSFIVGKTIDSTIIGIICFIAMWILGLPYAVLLSVIVGITNMIPYFGPFIGAIPGVLLYLCIDPLKALIFALMILALQQFDGWILGPKILGDSTGLTPLWVIFGITVGGAYGGVFGMFIGVPIVAVVAYLANLFITNRLKKKKIEIE